MSPGRPLVQRVLASEVPPLRERRARLRLMLLALTISLWALVIGIRLVQLQVLGRAFFEQQGARQSERTVNLVPAPRADPRPRRPAAGGLGGRRERLRGAAGRGRPAGDRSRARPCARPRCRGPARAAGEAAEERRLRLDRAQGGPRHGPPHPRAAARRHRLRDGAPALLPAARAGGAGAGLRGARQRGHGRDRVPAGVGRSAAARRRSWSTPTRAGGRSRRPSGPRPRARPWCWRSTSRSSTSPSASSIARWPRRRPPRAR